MAALYFILLLGVLITFHEFGHFLMARLVGVRVLVFSIGFGPRLTVYRSPRTGTEYGIGLIPLGGFVKMFGDEPGQEIPESERRGAFNYQPLWKRTLIVLAGPGFNLLLAPLVFFAWGFFQPVFPAEIGVVLPDGPAAAGGMQPGDRIVSIDGDPVRYWWQVQDHIAASAGRKVHIEVERGDRRVALDLVPRGFREGSGPFGRERGQIRVVSLYLQPIVAVAPASPAARGGLASWDRIVSVDGHPVRRWAALCRMLETARGHTVRVEALRTRDWAHATGFDLGVWSGPVEASWTVPSDGDACAASGLESAEMVVYHVRPNTPAAKLGLRRGDRIVKLDGEPLVLWNYMTGRIFQKPRSEHTLEWVRDGKPMEGTFKPLVEKRRNQLNAKVDMAIFGADNFCEYGTPQPIPNDAPLAFAWRQATRETWERVAIVGGGLVGLLTGHVPLSDLGGPILIGQLAARTADYGWQYFLNILVMLSINLFFINLLPIPVLDGGHLFFFAIEAVTRRPVSLRVRQAATYVGLVILILLMLVVFKNDIDRALGLVLPGGLGW